jgi:hypothetical protein
MSENPPSNQEPQDPFNNPEGSALIAYAELDELLTMWMKFHPQVAEEDVDAALVRFREAIRKRDEQALPE